MNDDLHQNLLQDIMTEMQIQANRWLFVYTPVPQSKQVRYLYITKARFSRFLRSTNLTPVSLSRWCILSSSFIIALMHWKILKLLRVKIKQSLDWYCCNEIQNYLSLNWKDWQNKIQIHRLKIIMSVEDRMCNVLRSYKTTRNFIIFLT